MPVSPEPPRPADHLREHFDSTHYRSRLRRAQRRRLARSGDDELADYLAHGWREGLDPSPSFSGSGYLHDNPDVRDSGTEPLTHWVLFGRAEGRPVVSPVEFADPDRVAQLPPALRLRRERVATYLADFGVEFDPRDFDRAVLDGSTEAPPWFDAAWYLVVNPDVRDRGIDPFVHFLLDGHHEDRLPSPVVGRSLSTAAPSIDVVLGARDIRVEGRRRLGVEPAHPVAPITHAVEAIRSALIGGSRTGVVLAIGHDDYTRNLGGVQMCEGFEQREFARRGLVYVLVHPIIPLDSVHPVEPERQRVGIIVDGVPLGCDFLLSDLTDAWEVAPLTDLPVSAFVVHSILGHRPEGIARLVRAASPERTVWWLHDRTAHCPNWTQMRNGVDFCGDPPPGSQACRLCSFGAERIGHLERLRELWAIADWEFVAPSSSAALSATVGATPIPGIPIVVPHLRMQPIDTPPPPRSPGRRLRLGFVGYPLRSKGWDVFHHLVARHTRSDLEFFHLGARPVGLERVAFVELRQEAGSFGASVDCMKEVGLDAVIIWPSWPETFSFVTAEAIAAGCVVVTHRGSGNVAAMARACGREIVFDDVAGLLGCRRLSSVIADRVASITTTWNCGPVDGLTPALLGCPSPSEDHT